MSSGTGKLPGKLSMKFLLGGSKLRTHRSWFENCKNLEDLVHLTDFEPQSQGRVCHLLNFLQLKQRTWIMESDLCSVTLKSIRESTNKTQCSLSARRKEFYRRSDNENPKRLESKTKIEKRGIENRNLPQFKDLLERQSEKKWKKASATKTTKKFWTARCVGSFI